MNVTSIPGAGCASADEERITAVARQMSRWVDQVLGKGFHGVAQAWTPAINFYECTDHYWVVVELAGIHPDKIDLRVENGLLILRGQRATPGLPEEHQAVRLLMMEIDHGNFSRSLKVPSDADVDAVSARYRNGYLWIRLPKKS